MPQAGERRAVAEDSDGPWLLLAELNHRVGNELMAALSALRVAQRGVRTAAHPSGVLDQAVLRLESFGQIHHLLDRNGNHGSLRQRLESLCWATAKAKGAPHCIHIAISADDVQADEETDWSVCAIAFELMTNAFRHAFSDSHPGMVSVSLRDEMNWLVLTVSDNGAGFASQFGGPVLSSLGLGSAIVAELADRLGGAVSRKTGPRGATVIVRIPAQRATQ